MTTRPQAGSSTVAWCRRVAVAGLGGLSLLHGAWAAGSTWPAADAEGLADLVVGRRPFPGPAATGVVAGRLGVIAGAVAAVRPTSDPSDGAPGPQVVRLLCRSAALVLVVRGGGGLVVSAAGLGEASDRFRRWDLRLYSPAALGLGAATAVVAWAC